MIKAIKNINPVIWILTLSDVFVWGIYLIASPMQAIYMTEKYGEDSVKFVTTGLSIYYLLRAVLQIPIGRMVDVIKKETDEIYSLMIGGTLIGASFMIFPFITSPIQYYWISALAGVGTAFNLIGWRKLFAKNLDKNMEGFEYATYETVMSLCTAVFGLLSSGLSMLSKDFFTIFFFVVGLITLVGGIVVSAILLHLKTKVK